MCRPRSGWRSLCSNDRGHGRVDMHPTFSEPRKELIQEINLERILDGLSITREKFVDLCILMGCDFLDPIKIVGPHTAVTGGKPSQ